MPALGQFVGQHGFVDGLQQSGSQSLVDVESSVHDLAGDLVFSVPCSSFFPLRLCGSAREFFGFVPFRLRRRSCLQGPKLASLLSYLDAVCRSQNDATPLDQTLRGDPRSGVLLQQL
jgi:hypothetical protein